MSRDIFHELANEYCRTWREVNDAYEKSARIVGMSYSSMLTLNVIFYNPGTCTQKLISEESFLPKQTVNAIITGFWKQGLVEMSELKTDRRTKIIHLTEQGQALAEKIIPKIKSAESGAMKKLTKEQRIALLENAKLYAACFQDSMREHFGIEANGESE